MAPPKSESYLGLQRFDDYYLLGGDLYCIAENKLFRVHRYFFERESTFFKAELALPATPGAPRIGTSDDSAILLHDVRSADFAKLLWVFYNPKYSLYDTTVEDWTTILDLAHRWGFVEVKNLAVRELEKLVLPDVDRIVLYHKYSVDEKILIPRYMTLCMRPELLTVEEGLKLGMGTVIALTRTRECTRNQTTNGSGDGWRSPSPASLSEKELTDIIKDHFNIKPEPTKSAEPANASTSKTKDSGASAGSTGTEPGSPSTAKSGNKTPGGTGGEWQTNGTGADGTGANRKGKSGK